MELRREFVELARHERANIRQLCARFGISAPTGYKWLARYAAEGAAGLAERSRRPHTSPGRTPALLEALVLAVRDQFPTWGGRKIKAYLERHGDSPVPSASTITRILERHGRLDAPAASRQGPFQRFEAAAPNTLWQVDFKGHFALERGRCHPLSVLDDHSRYLLGLVACGDQQQRTVQAHLISVFERYGLPRRILSDNGPPWGTTGNGGCSAFEVWLLQLGIEVSHGRAYHPQTQGKVERFHRTLKAEVVSGAPFPDLATCQLAFDRWRLHYNTERPHDALDLAVPGSRYQPSPRAYPAQLPAIVYASAELVRMVKADGFVAYRGGHYRVGKGLRGQRVALRPTRDPQVLSVYLGRHHITDLDLDIDWRV
jgi:transposase InsO family protein